MLKLTKRHARKVLKVVDAGLCYGKGEPIPGQMCVEAAVCFALGEPFSDEPSCVSPTLRQLKINLNDKAWSSNQARAKGLRRIAIAQLGTKDTLDEIEFMRRVAKTTIQKTVPAAIRLATDKVPEPHKSNMLAAALRCEQEGTEEAAREANKVTRAYYTAASASASASAAAYAAAYDKVLSQYAEDVVQILIDMKTPGSKWLDITED